jgi:hypothetical protein
MAASFGQSGLTMSTKIVFIHCGALACLLYAAGVIAQEVAWRDDRPLAWSDFKGTVTRDAEPRDVAVTAASLGWTYAYELELSDRGCSYRITSISATAAFHPKGSWVRPGHETEAVLAHEQGHFDITELERRAFESLARGYVGAAGSCRGRNPQRAANYIESDIGRIVGPHYEQASRDHIRRQEHYDLETAHGTDEAAQRKWLARIAAELRGAKPSSPY